MIINIILAIVSVIVFAAGALIIIQMIRKQLDYIKAINLEEYRGHTNATRLIMIFVYVYGAGLVILGVYIFPWL
jgi:divalent metal cation (Fe/Co/Zn/Cd) transporter